MYLGEGETLLVIIATIEEKLLRVLKENKTAIRWTLADIKSISPAIYMHKIIYMNKILLKDDAILVREP
jgi:hypothetical protein